MHKFLTAFVISVFCISVINAQNIQLAGTVTDERLKPLASATIVLEPEHLETLTVTDGSFQFSNLFPGTYKVKCTHIGFKPFEGAITVYADKKNVIKIKLSPQQQMLQNVEVRAFDKLQVPDNLIKAERSAMPVQVITRRMIELMGSRRLDEVLKEQTGVAIVNNIGGGSRSVGVQMQGFGSDYVMILIDGQPMLGRNSGSFDLSRISVANIERIEIIKGASSCLYGSEALGGAINIITKYGVSRPQALATITYGSLNITDATVEGQTPFYHKRGSATVSANYYHTDGFNTNPYLTSGTTAPPYDNYSIQGRMRYQLSKKSSIGLTGRYGLRRSLMSKNWGDDLINNDYQNERDLNITTNFDHRFGIGLRTMTRYYFTRYTTDETVKWSGQSFNAAQNIFGQSLHRLEQQFAQKVNNRLELTAGLGATYEQINEAQSDQQKRSQYAGFAYVQGSWNVHKKLNVLSGLRYDYTRYYGGKINPSLGLQYQLHPSLILKAGMGTGFKAPDFRMLYQVFYNPTANYLVIGNELLNSTLQTLRNKGQISETRNYIVQQLAKGLEPERSISWNVGAVWQPKPKIKIEGSVFYHKIYNQIDAVLVATGTEIDQIYSYRNLPRAVNKGVEGSVAITLFSNFDASVGYQYLVSKDQSIEDSIRAGNWPYNINIHDSKTGNSFAPKPSDYWGIENRSRHMLNIKLLYTYIPWNLSINARLNYRGKFPFGDYNGNQFIDQFDTFVPGHGLLNLSFEKKLPKQRMSLRLTFDNLLNFTSIYIPGQPGRLILAGVTYRIFK